MSDWWMKGSPVDQAVNRVLAKPGPRLFVDTVNGNDRKRGEQWPEAVKTMGRAFELMTSLATIYFTGNIREQLVGPNTVFDVTFIGAANRTRNDGATWRAPASAAADLPLLEIRAQGWRFHNILFNAPLDAAAIKLTRNALESAAEFDASHFNARDCAFIGGAIGIQDHGGCHNYLVERCRFRDFVSELGPDGIPAGILCTSTAVAMPLRGTLRECEFINNVNHVLSSMSSFIVERNLFQREGHQNEALVTLDTIHNSGQGGQNVVQKNTFAGFDAAEILNVNGFTGSASDSWIANECDDQSAYGVPASGA